MSAKSIGGGGVPIGAFGPRDEIMDEIMLKDGIIHAGTYNSNPLVVRAALVTLRGVLSKDVYEPVSILNTRLVEGLRRVSINRTYLPKLSMLVRLVRPSASRRNQSETAEILTKTLSTS